jgi:hypothetical protein
MGKPSIGACSVWCAAGVRYWVSVISTWMWRRFSDLLGDVLLELSPSESVAN